MMRYTVKIDFGEEANIRILTLPQQLLTYECSSPKVALKKALNHIRRFHAGDFATGMIVSGGVGVTVHASYSKAVVSWENYKKMEQHFVVEWYFGRLKGDTAYAGAMGFWWEIKAKSPPQIVTEK